MHHPTDRIIHTTAFVTPVVEHWPEREIAQWVQRMAASSVDTDIIVDSPAGGCQFKSNHHHRDKGRVRLKYTFDLEIKMI